MNKTKIGLGLGIIAMFAIVAFALSAPAVQNVEQVVDSAPAGDGFSGALIGYDGYVTINKYEAETGQWKLVEASKHNLITNIGINFIRAKLNGSDVTAVNNLSSVSLSADAGGGIAAGDTQLASEITTNGLARNTSVWSVNGTSGFNLTAVWTATNSQSAASTGLNWLPGNTNNNLFAELPFTQQDLLVNDQLQVIWQIVIS